MDLKPVFYVVERIDGDYAYLRSEAGNENQVARALLPYDIDEGTKLKWEMFSYTIID